MVGSRFGTIVLVLALTALGGCMGEKATVKPTPLEVPPAPAPEATESTGAVTGQIVSEAFRPIPEIDVALAERSGTQVLTRTDGDGRFTFNGVATGAYRLLVSHPCCRPTGADVDVQAGNVSVVNLAVPVLTPAELGFPYSVVREWKGFVSCGAAAEVTVNCIVQDQNTDYRHEFNVSAGLVEIVAVLQWDASPHNAMGTLAMDLRQNVCNDCAWGYGSVGGHSPVFGSWDEGNMTDGQFPFSQIETQAQLEFAVQPESPNVVYQQSFHVAWAEFYHEPAPDSVDPRDTA